jgi:hypothetical protein
LFVTECVLEAMNERAISCAANVVDYDTMFDSHGVSIVGGNSGCKAYHANSMLVKEFTSSSRSRSVG